MTFVKSHVPRRLVGLLRKGISYSRIIKLEVISAFLLSEHSNLRIAIATGVANAAATQRNTVHDATDRKLLGMLSLLFER